MAEDEESMAEDEESMAEDEESMAENEVAEEMALVVGVKKLDLVVYQQVLFFIWVISLDTRRPPLPDSI